MKNLKRSPWAWIPRCTSPRVAVRGGDDHFGNPVQADGVSIPISRCTPVGFTALGSPKPFWVVLVDLLKTKRWWIVTMQLLLGARFAGIAFTIPLVLFDHAGFFLADGVRTRRRMTLP